MKYIDFLVQTILLATVLVLIIANVGGTDWLLLVMWMQLLIGPWQLLSSVISVGMRWKFYRLKEIHLLISGVYIAILFAFPYNNFPAVVGKVLLMVPAWSLAIYYYVLTTRAAFRVHAPGGRFLPHTSF